MVMALRSLQLQQQASTDYLNNHSESSTCHSSRVTEACRASTFFLLCAGLPYCAPRLPVSSSARGPFFPRSAPDLHSVCRRFLFLRVHEVSFFRAIRPLDTYFAAGSRDG